MDDGSNSVAKVDGSDNVTSKRIGDACCRSMVELALDKGTEAVLERQS